MPSPIKSGRTFQIPGCKLWPYPASTRYSGERSYPDGLRAPVSHQSLGVQRTLPKLSWPSRVAVILFQQPLLSHYHHLYLLRHGSRVVVSQKSHTIDHVFIMYLKIATCRGFQGKPSSNIKRSLYTVVKSFLSTSLPSSRRQEQYISAV